MKISIITPNFNTAKYIEQTIKSVITQKGTFEIEYIIIDGKSTDASLEIIQKYAALLKHNPRITFIWKSEKDKGQSDAINKGLRLATGDIIAYLNADDIYEQNAFKHIIKAFKKHKDIGFIYGKCRIIDEDNKEIRKGIKLIRTTLGRTYSYAKLLVINFIPQPATFWKREVYETMNEFDVNEHHCMDYEYWCRIGTKYKGMFLNEPIAQFRWYLSSKSGANYKKQFFEELEIAKKYGTSHPFSIFMHKFMKEIIIAIYSIMRFFKL